MQLFSYNSKHKIITAGLLVIAVVTIYFLTTKDNNQYYSNGQIKCIGVEKNGVNNGVWTWYFENGTKNIQGEFIQGKRSGAWKTWNANGILLIVLLDAWKALFHIHNKQIFH